MAGEHEQNAFFRKYKLCPKNVWTSRTPFLTRLSFDLLGVLIRASGAKPLMLGTGQDGQKVGKSDTR